MKRQSKEAVDELTTRSSILAEENRGLKVKLHACLDELDFRNGQVQQLREENTRKWRVEERNDWKSLLDSVQRDRAEPQEANEYLQERCARKDFAVCSRLWRCARLHLSATLRPQSCTPFSRGGALRAPLSSRSSEPSGAWSWVSV